MTNQVFYKGKEIAAFYDIEGYRSDKIVVTFTPRLLVARDLDADLAAYASGYGFFRSRGIATVNFICRSNIWWQTPEAWEAIDVLLSSGVLGKFENIWTYGSSMGATAAVLFANRLGATGVLAIVPQYTMDLSKTPWEDRFPEMKDIGAIIDDRLCPIEQGTTYVVYDPFFETDVRHCREVLRAMGGTGIEVPFSWHFPSQVLLDCGMLAEFLLTTIEGKHDALAFRRKLRERRHMSPTVLNSASLTAFDAGKMKLASRFSKHAVELIDTHLATGKTVAPFLIERTAKHHALQLHSAHKNSEARVFLDRWKPYLTDADLSDVENKLQTNITSDLKHANLPGEGVV